MRVIIKADLSIPEGYTLIDCNKYTPEEFIRACGPLALNGRVNLNAVDYVRQNPRKEYDTEDLHRVRMMRPMRFGKTGLQKQQNARQYERRAKDKREGEVQYGDLSASQASEYFGINWQTVLKMVRENGLPYRQCGRGNAPIYIRLREVAGYLTELKGLTKVQRKMLERLRRDGYAADS